MGDRDRLKLLMWKYFQFRKYYWFITIFEILFPVILVYSIIKITQSTTDTMEIKVQETKDMQTEKLESYWTYDTILYTPSSFYNSRAVDYVQKEVVKSTKRNIIVTPEDNENDMVLKISKSDSANIAGIVFLEMSNRFFYKIRDKNVYNTSEMFLENESQESEPPDVDVYMSRGFLALMELLNTYFIMLKQLNETGITERSQVLHIENIFRNFPYPEYNRVSQSRALLPLVMAFVLVLTSLILCSTVLFIIISEKSTGMMELMKIIGIPEKLIWFTSFLNVLPVGLITFTLVTMLLKYDFFGTDAAVFRWVHGSVLWMCLVLYYISQIAFCFMFCAMFNSILLASTSFVVATMIMSYLALKCYQWKSTVFVHLSCFIPAGAFVQSFLRFAYYEVLGVPLPWSALFANEINASDASVGFTFLLFVFDTFLYLFLTYYLTVVSPSRYGFKKSPFFLINKGPIKRYKERIKETKTNTKKRESTEETENPFIEPPPENAEISIVLQGLQKNFGHVPAVKNVSLNMYKNEIIVLLGFAGSGKTTTLSMITGLTEPTDGKILFKNIDLLKNITEFRKNLGVCLQEDCLFPYMTVGENLVFFGMLKGATEAEAIEESKEYLNLMDMELNADDRVVFVNKGMKRKLSLSMALMGKADVLILDAPTENMDNPSKRRIWIVLKKLRKNRTIIFTSSSMSEANELGDRIAIMNQGVVVAHGSSEFLKRAFGVGYRLKVKRKKIIAAQPTADVLQQLIDAVRKSIPGSKVESRSAAEIVFSLPVTHTAKFPAFIRGLESKKTAFNIERLIMSGTTMEHVFYRLGGESIYDTGGMLLTPRSAAGDPVNLKRLDEKVEGFELGLLQHQALFVKKFLYVYRNGRIFLFRVVLPTMLLLLLLRGTVRLEKIDPPLELTLEAAYPNAIVIVLQNDSNSAPDFSKKYISYVKEIGARIRMMFGYDAVQALLNYARENIHSYRREVIIGNDLNSQTEGQTKTYFSRWARHSAPVALTTVHNAQLRSYTSSEAYEILPVNHPVKSINVTKVRDQFATDLGEQSPIITVWFILLAFFTVDLLEYFSFPVKMERINGFKQIQLLSSVPIQTYWINNFIFDFLLFFIILILRLIAFRAFDFYGFFGLKYHMLIVLILFVLFIASGLLFIYVVSFSVSSNFGSYLFFFLFNFICASVTFAYYKHETSLFSGSPTSSIGHVILTFTKYFILLVPPLNFSLAIEKLIMNWRVNHLVEAYAQLNLDEKSFRSEGVEYFPYLQYASVKNPNGILGELQFLVIDTVLYAGILYVIEQGIVMKYIYSKRYQTNEEDETETPPTKGPIVPDDIKKERSKVDQLTSIIEEDPTVRTKNVLIVQNLQKIFERLFRKPITAVKNITFTVSAGECFGILGPKGAGKTTTFKMLTGEILPTKGESWILNVSLKEDKKQYFSQTGYCAETNCFLDELTGKETLNIIASMKGVPFEEREAIVEKWITIMGLEGYENKKCGQYSGGNRRKICAALALIGDPGIVFLDEPASGVDPVSRQRLYNVLNLTKSTGQAVTLASHSIEECETLCDRLTILIKGDMKFIGTTEELKKKYGQGFSLSITLKEPAADEKLTTREEQIGVLKNVTVGKFKKGACVLKEETRTMLRYHIKHVLPLADVFQKMEELKKDQKIVAQYFLTERSLEEVYHSFAEELD